MSTFIHSCPHCGTQLHIRDLEVERTAASCPNCKETVILLDYGRIMKKPTVYRCLKCKHLIYSEHLSSWVHCNQCDSTYLPSEHGNCLISPDLYSRGENGELSYTKKRDRNTELRNKWIGLSTTNKIAVYIAVVCVIALFVGLYIHSLPDPTFPDPTFPDPIEQSLAYSDKEIVWREFRDKNPYNIQFEGIKSYSDGSYLMLLTEPNEDVTLENLEECFKEYNCYIETSTIGIGYDGWLQDAIVCFNDIDEDDLPELYSSLYNLLYGTDYKAMPMDLSIIPEHTAFASENLNLQVTEEELRSWFIEGSEPLASISDSTSIYDLNTIFDKDIDDSELFISKEPGFVVWVFKKGYCYTENFRVNARMFSLDSDLILGSISKGDKVAIIARERCVPTYVLPPMRVETLRILSGTNEDELSQSYERTSLFAGKQSGGKDYAPIYLSDELWHTEYGNILNVTDQMLKSWSENGMIDYVNFDYPKPVNWTFNSGVMKDLDVSRLTYNWNTAGVGYIVEDDDYSIYALNRTGSLPVSYIPGISEGISDKDPVYQAEQQAYDFFSNLNTPELVKVVQYVVMYQIFRNFGIHTSSKSIFEYYDEIFVYPYALKKSAANLIRKLAFFSEDTKSELVEHYNLELLSKDQLSERKKSDSNFEGLKIDNAEYYICGYTESLDELLNLFRCRGVMSNMAELHETLSPLKNDETLLNCLGSYIIDRIGTDVEYSTECQRLHDGSTLTLGSLGMSVPKKKYVDCITDAMIALQSHGFELQTINEAVGDVSIERARDLYLEVNEDKSRGWMKCPTIVESWSLEDSTTQVGGHNLDSKVTRFKVSKDVQVGKTREANGVIEINAKDRMNRISDPDYLRKVGRLGNSKLTDANIAVRPKVAALGETKVRSARGFNGQDHLRIEFNEKTGHTVNGKKYTDLTELLDDVGHHLSDGEAQFKEITIKGMGDAGVEVDVFLDGVKGRMRKGSNANIPYSKYDFNNVAVTMEGDVAHVTIPIKSGKIEFGSTSNISKAGMGGSSDCTPIFENIKGGKVEFTVPRSRVQQFLDLIRQYISKQKGNWNDFKIRMEMKRRGIPPSEIQNEGHSLRVAKNNLKHYESVQYISEKTIA